MVRDSFLLDMTKAYDMVKFKILLDKVYGICLRGIPHKCIASYLENRNNTIFSFL